MTERKGSAFVEAALIFPLIILILAGALTLTVGLYEKLEAQTETHREEREIHLHEADLVRLIDLGRGITEKLP